MAVDGTYKVDMSTPMGTQTGNLTLKADGNALSGSYATARGTQNFTGTVEGETCKWQMNVPSPMGGTLTLSFNVKITGNDLAGQCQLGQFGMAPVKGTKTG